MADQEKETSIVTPWRTLRFAEKYTHRGGRFLRQAIARGELRAARVGGRNELFSAIHGWMSLWSATAWDRWSSRGVSAPDQPSEESAAFQARRFGRGTPPGERKLRLRPAKNQIRGGGIFIGEFSVSRAGRTVQAPGKGD